MQGLKEGQILRTISNMTYSDSHYTSDEDKLGEVSVCRPFPLPTLRPRPSVGAAAASLEPQGCTILHKISFDGPSSGYQVVHAYYVLPCRAGRHTSVAQVVPPYVQALRRGDFHDAPMVAVERLDSLTPRLEMPLSLEAAACTLSMAGADTLENACKGQQPCQPGAIRETIKQTCAENSHAVFDMVVNAGGSLPPRDVQQNFCLRSECSGAFADALNSIDFSAGGTLSPKLLVSPLLSYQPTCHLGCTSHSPQQAHALLSHWSICRYITVSR